MSQHTQDPALRAATIPCPTCSCTGTDTYEDRHTGTNMDTCRTCGGNGYIAARTGETPEASYQPPLSATPAHAPGKAGDREGLDEIGGPRDVLVSLIQSRLMGIVPDDQDLELEDSDWRLILKGLDALAPSPAGNEAPRGEGREAAAAERYRAGAMDMRQTAGDAVNAMAHKMRGSGKDPLAAAALGDAVLAIRALPLAAAPPPPVSTEPDSRAGAEQWVVRRIGADDHSAVICAKLTGQFDGCTRDIAYLGGHVDDAEKLVAAQNLALAALHPSPPTASGAAAPVGEEFKREMALFLQCVKALLRHTTPTDVSEDHAHL